MVKDIVYLWDSFNVVVGRSTGSSFKHGTALRRANDLAAE